MEKLIKDDFDLRKIVYSGQCFRPIELEPNVYRFITGENVLYIRDLGENLFDVSCDNDTWENIWVPYFDLNRNYKKIRDMIPVNDTFMVNAANIGKGVRILNQAPFEMLISFIISQRKSIPAIRSSVEKICTCYGKKIETQRETLHLFPSATDICSIGFDALSDCSLGYRLPYIEQVSCDIASGAIDLSYANTLDDSELLSYLMNIKGVGIKVASCVALFAFSRGAIAPVDVWINRVIDEYYNGSTPFPGYGENSGIYQQYAFYYMTNSDKA